MTQKQIILSYLKANPTTWFKSYQLRGANTPFGFAGHQADRRARELAESGAIEVRHDGKYAEYKYKPSLADRVIARANNYQPMNLKLI